MRSFVSTWLFSLQLPSLFPGCFPLFRHTACVLHSPIERLGFGISTDQLQKAKKVIGVAGGEEKYEGILASLKSGLLNVLITDFDTAIKLLD